MLTPEKELERLNTIKSKKESITNSKAIKEAMQSGVKGIFTMHGKDMKDIENNLNINQLLENKQIEKIIFL